MPHILKDLGENFDKKNRKFYQQKNGKQFMLYDWIYLNLSWLGFEPRNFDYLLYFLIIELSSNVKELGKILIKLFFILFLISELSFVFRDVSRGEGSEVKYNFVLFFWKTNLAKRKKGHNSKRYPWIQGRSRVVVLRCPDTPCPWDQNSIHIINFYIFKIEKFIFLQKLAESILMSK